MNGSPMHPAMAGLEDDIKFMQNLFKHYWLYLVFSALVILPGMFVIGQYGLKPSIDFTGGSLIEVEFSQSLPDEEEVRNRLSENFEISSVQRTDDQSLLIRSKTITNEQKNQLVENLYEFDPDLTERRFESVGPTLGRELLMKTIFAVLIVAVVITLFIMRQFTEVKFGLSAVLAMFHDTAVLFSVFALLGYFYGVEIDVLFVTAVLTTLSFSVHDTIVLFDRIRELRSKHRGGSLRQVSEAALLQTITRSLNNSLTIIFMLLSLVLLGGDTLRYFAVALLVGAITGTYSSAFTAIPLLLLMNDLEAWWKKGISPPPAGGRNNN